LKIKFKLFVFILFLAPLFFYFIFNYLEIPKFFFLNIILYFNNYYIITVILFIFLFTFSILLFLPLGAFFYIISGIIFGTLHGYLYSLSAILISTSISFYFYKKNFTHLAIEKKYYKYLKKFKFSSNEILNIFLLRLSFFIPISIQNILSLFVTKNILKLLFVTTITTSPPMFAIINGVSKISNRPNYDEPHLVDLTNIYIVIFLSLIIINLIRLFVNSLIKKNNNYPLYKKK